MTKVKLPSSSSHNNNNKTTKIVLASVAVLALVTTLLWSSLAAPASQHPQELRVRSVAAISTNDVKQQAVAAAGGGSLEVAKQQQQSQPGVHRYEMILAQLKSDDGSDSTGKVIIETYDAWAPLGVAHFDKLVVSSKFYDDCRFFRVLDNFVVQFGINGDPAVQRQWRQDVLKDDPVVETNAYGTLTYATSGPNSRTTQLFINTNRGGNGGLDRQGFAPIGKIVSGMEYVMRINDEYREKPNQGMIQRNGNEYLNREFPRLSYIAQLRSLDDPSPGGDVTAVA